MKKKYVLDTFAILAYLKEEDNFEKVKDILSSHKTVVFMNDINIGETFYIIARERGMETAEYFFNVILLILPITHIENTLNEVIEASKIKAEYPISYADSFTVATACKEGATVITGDSEFKLVEKIVTVDWL